MVLFISLSKINRVLSLSYIDYSIYASPTDDKKENQTSDKNGIRIKHVVYCHIDRMVQETLWCIDVKIGFMIVGSGYGD